MRSALKGVAGVSTAAVSMPDKAVVTYDPKKVNVKDLIKAVKAAGYKAKVAKAKKVKTK